MSKFKGKILQVGLALLDAALVMAAFG